MAGITEAARWLKLAGAMRAARRSRIHRHAAERTILCRRSGGRRSLEQFRNPPHHKRYDQEVDRDA